VAIFQETSKAALHLIVFTTCFPKENLFRNRIIKVLYWFFGRARIGCANSFIIFTNEEICHGLLPCGDRL